MDYHAAAIGSCGTSHAVNTMHDLVAISSTLSLMAMKPAFITTTTNSATQSVYRRNPTERLTCLGDTARAADVVHSGKFSATVWEDPAAATHTRIYDTIEAIDAAEWDAIIGDNSLVRSHAYLAAIEASSIAKCRYYYPVIRNRAGQIIAHACVYTIETDFAQLLPEKLQICVAQLRKAWGNFLRVRVTECAAPLTSSYSISFAPQVDRPRLIAELGVALESIAKNAGSRLVVIRDFLAKDRETFDGFLDANYNVVSNMPLARIRVRWRSYDEYLSSMRSRYRKDVRRRLRRSARMGQTVRVLDSFAGQAELWGSQAATVQSNTKGFKREVLPARYYKNMDEKLGEKSILVTAQRDGRSVAHGMVLHDDSETIATYFGRDPGPASQEWFQLVNEVIRIGIERGSDYINLGLGSYDAKANVGADVEPLFVYSKSSFAPINWLMRVWPRYMDHVRDDSKRVFTDSRN